MALSIVIILVVGYLLGNLNGAVVISRLLEADDVRSHGSGNAGFTNFFRNYGGVNSLFVVLIDLGKAAAATILGGMLLSRFGYDLEGRMLGAMVVSLGHDFPALLHFKGGKGIMCGLGAALAADWPVAVLILAVFLFVCFLTNYVSLASIMACIAFILGFWLRHPDNPLVVLMGAVIALFAIWMHRENIKRLLTHTERKTYFFKRGNKA